MGITTYLLSQLFEYETNKVIIINSKRISLVNRFIQTCILAYIIGYVLVLEKSYQTFDDVRSAITSKVKGSTVTNYSDDDFQIKKHMELYNRVWDPIEYIIPPSENGAFFIMTNAIITPNQTQTVCDEAVEIKDSWCGTGYPPCPVGEIFRFGNGRTTGRCVNSTQKLGVKVCEVKAWCPVELDQLPLKNKRPLINIGEDYTVLIKNSIDFPNLGTKYRRLSLNHEFGRRTMLKAYGIKFILETQGRAGKFDLVPTLLNVGAGLGLMELASIFSDLVLLFLANSRNQYKKRKFAYVEGEDSFHMNNMNRWL